MARERIYTKTGDDGTTGLFYGGRVRKDSELPTAYGTVDEAQAILGLARAGLARGSELDTLLVEIERDLYVLMAELATLPENRHKLTAGSSAVSGAMVERLEGHIDAYTERFEPPTEFVVPGEHAESAWLDLARTVVRRAERHALVAVATQGGVGEHGGEAPSLAVQYLNRLSDLLWTLARWREGESRLAKS